MYKSAGQPGAGGAAGAAGASGDGQQSQSKPKDDVVDAEFVDVDPKDKK
jgi:hypothetical protein